MIRILYSVFLKPGLWFCSIYLTKNATKVTIIRAALETQWRPTGYSHYNWLNGEWLPQFLSLGVKTKTYLSSYLILPTPVPLLHVYCNLLTIVSKWPAVYTDGDFQTAWLSSCESLSCGCLFLHVTVDKSTACRKTGSRCHGLIQLIFYFKYVSWLKIAHLGGERAIL